MMIEISEMSYEQAFAELEATVRQLEDGELSLDASVTLFERGRKLAERCQYLLDAAELRVSQIGEDGTITAL